jgi:signal transduction histidine kinase
MSSARRSTGSLQPAELKAVYAISRVVAEVMDVDAALAEIVRLSRPVFIFDNAVLYLESDIGKGLEPAFAKAIGRGKSSKDDISWGESAAQKAFDSGKRYLKEPKESGQTDRLEKAFYLGIPLSVRGTIIGSLVFIRFGGPTYTDSQINLAEFIAAHVSQVLEHRRLVSQVAKLEAEKQLSQLQANFLATVSHELKTPLGFIKGYSSSLLREDTKWTKAERHEFLEIIDDESNRMGELVDNLLDSSRLQSGNLPMHFADFDLSMLINELKARINIQYPEATIIYGADQQDVQLDGDAKRIEQVLNNIIGNAIKYAPASAIDVKVTETKQEIQIVISDAGPGIPQEHLDKIFERFYRVPDKKRIVRGTGLGLYISKQIIETHGGSINAASNKGKGTRFTIRLPKAQELAKMAIEDV